MRMDFRVSAELASVAIKELPNRYAQGIIERKNPVIDWIACGGRHLQVVELDKGEETEDIDDDDLDVDLADILQPPTNLSVMVE